jgi:hypothetical protein
MYAGTVSVTKREAEPQFVYSSVTPYTSTVAVAPSMYSGVYANPLMYAQTPVVYQTSGCRNSMGSIVPCAMGSSMYYAPASVVPQAQVSVAPVQQMAAAAPASGTVISVKKREAEADTLYYADTYKFPGYTYRAFGDAAPIAAPTSYTVSAPIVSSVATAPVVAPVVSTSYVAPVISTSYVAPTYVPVTGCRNEQGSLVPCA